MKFQLVRGFKSLHLQTMVIFLLVVSSSHLMAQEESALGLHYQKYTNNEFLTELMQDLEPKLIAFYKRHDQDKQEQIRTALNMAIALGKDKPYKSTIQRIKSVSPDTLLKFLKLPKDKYPNLWYTGDIERIDRETEKSLRLYKALHGKEYENPSEN